MSCEKKGCRYLEIVSGGVRRVFAGTGGFPIAAAGMALVGTVFLIAILASPGSWEWHSAKHVRGSEENGVVYYSYGGQRYSVDDVNSFRSGPRDVWLDPSNPSDAVLQVAVAKASDWALTAGPYTAAVVLLGAGFWRRHRIRRDKAERAEGGGDGFGDGLDSDTVRRLMEDRGGPQGPG